MNNIDTNATPEQDIDINVPENNNYESDQDYESDEAEMSAETGDTEEQDSRFKDGETITLVRVRFPGNARSFPFLIGKRKFQYGQKVMAMSDRGMTVGYINSFPYQTPFNKTMLPLRSIARIASDEDIRQQIEFHESEKKAEVICLRLIERYQLDMVLTHVEFIQFGKKAVFYFNAPQRVDFRDLVKDLVGELKMRIELRQISVRDRAAALGSIGACGLQTCCSSFLKNYGNVSIKMAKNQNLALIPSKLNGVCGQIKCCIKYEDEVYSDKRKNLPKEGSIVQALNGDIGKTLRLHLLVEQFELLTDNGVKRRYASNQFGKESLELPANYKFPEFFENIIDETKTVIGLTKEEELISKRFKELMNQDLEDEDEEDNYSEELNDDLMSNLDEDQDSDNSDTDKIELSANSSEQKAITKPDANTRSNSGRQSQHRQHFNHGKRPHNNNRNDRAQHERNSNQQSGQKQHLSKHPLNSKHSKGNTGQNPNQNKKT